MIDLRTKGLPNAIICNGESFSIKTDFREWLKFDDILKRLSSGESVNKSEFLPYFAGEVPFYSDNVIAELIKFYTNPNITPIDIGSYSDRKLLDYIEDGEYIVASFLAEYGIDLTEVEYLHWWKFQALFRSLRDDSKIMQIMGYRAHRKSNKSMEENYQRQCDVWTFPDKEQMEESERLLEEFNKL